MTIQIVRATSEATQTSPKSIEKARLINGEPADEICCNLSDLVQPHFFCGQLLTDQDLTTLLNWAQEKFRLNRYRDGWGVVCGLAVHCDPKRDNHVIVRPGYALDCCGDEIVLSQETAIDLSEACRKGVDPCGELNSKQTANISQESFQLLDLSMPEGELRTVDLYIRYREVQSDPQTALGRSVCKEVAECEYSRTKESYAFTLACQEGMIQTDPSATEVERWKKGYNDCSKVLDRFREDNPEDVKGWLLRWIDRYPLQHFCFIRDWLCDPDLDTLTAEQITQVLFLLVQDCRITYLSHDCHDCLDNIGVPLARIWLNITEAQGKRRCQVINIDSYPPYRRPLSRETWPVPPGSVNLGQIIWRRWPEVCLTLAQLGIRVRNVKEEMVPGMPRDLQEWLSNADALIISCGSEVEVRVLGVQGERRVIGFSRVAREPREREAAEDDLTKIRGISANRAQILRDYGITSYAALVETPNERLRELQLRAGDNDFNDWKEQARNLMED